MASFDEVLKDCTKLGTKIPTSEYLESGKYPIIDQGQNDIAGYYDSDDGLFEDVPTIVFGDHTRVVKYVDKPCFLGADGVKLLCPLDKDINCKYLFYQLSCADIPNTGYNRHFKWVKALDFKIPSSDEQNHVVEVLDKVTELISLRKQQLAKLDELVKARFVEMFGDSVANTKNFPSTTLETVMTVFPQNGLYKPQTDYVQDDTGIPILRIDAFYNGKVTNWKTLKRLICSETEIDRYLLRENDIVINRVNSIEYLGKCAHIVGLKEKTVFESNMMRFHIDEKKVNAVYVTEVLCTEDIYRQILRRAKKSVNQASINQEDVKSLEILVPPLSFQNQFAAFVERVDKQKQTVQQSLEKLELMKKALMQEYFG